LFIEKQACAALLVLLSPLALAVEAANQDPHAHHQMASAELDATLIKAAADELGARQVSQESLRSLAPSTSDTASLLRGTPGVSLNGAGGISSLPAIRGLGNDRL